MISFIYPFNVWNSSITFRCLIYIPPGSSKGTQRFQVAHSKLQRTATSKSFLLILTPNLSPGYLSLLGLVLSLRLFDTSLIFLIPFRYLVATICLPGLPSDETYNSEKNDGEEYKTNTRSSRRIGPTEVRWDSSRTSNTRKTLPYM